jgi:hypothetical protein
MSSERVMNKGTPWSNLGGLRATLLKAIGTIVAFSVALHSTEIKAQAGTVSSGTSSNLGAYQHPQPYSLPPGKSPTDIVGIGIARDDHVYVWYRDGTVSSGTSWDFSRYRRLYDYSLPSGKSREDIVEMGIMGSKDHVYVWYKR